MTAADLRLQDLSVTYRGARGPVPAVRSVTLAIAAGAPVGLAGESGSGKSTIAHAVLRLLPPGTELTGQILLDGEDVVTMGWGRLRAVRWAGAAIVFQGALHALNPIRRVVDQVAEPVLIHSAGTTHRQARDRAAEMLSRVGLPAGTSARYPHQLSGGQRQLALIAMAMVCSPRFVIADEPTSAVDTVTRARVVRLLTATAAEQDIGLLLISHDLTLLTTACTRLAVMYAGRVIEHGPTADLASAPRHPYTAALLAAAPAVGDPAARYRPRGLPGDPPDPTALPPGCAFQPRCPRATAACATTDVELRADGPARRTACLHPGPAT
ncbi:MAG TPA: ABC transporter ATP-binding protein [Mycobacteriales bacterium]|nr:ABC transporter ATP-binding protein [Mycobacteriales bacterium]